MTPNAFGRAIAVYPALLAAYAGEPVTLSPNEALALLGLFGAVDGLATEATPPIRTLWDPALSDANIEFVMPCDADRPARAPRAAAWERALKRGTRRTAA